MSLLTFESFDVAHNMIDSQPNQPWTQDVYQQNLFHVNSEGRRSTSGMRTYLQSYESYFRQLDLTILGGEQSALVMGFALKPGSGGSYGGGIALDFWNANNTRQFVMDWTSAGRIRILSAPGGSILAQSADGALTFDIYQYFEIKFTCDDTAGIVQVRIDGVDVIAETGNLNLQQAGSGSILKIRFHAPANQIYNSFDDLYLCNQLGSYSDFLGDVKVDAFLPTGDGNYQQFTSNRSTHYDAINDIGVNAVTYYIESDTVGEKDSFSITPTGDLPTIHAISVRSTACNPDTGVAEGTLFIRQGGVDYDQATFERGDTIKRDDQMLLSRPDTAGVWTKAALEAMEFGFEFSAAS